MATSMVAVSRRMYHRVLLSNNKASAPQIFRSYFSTKSDSEGERSAPSSDSDESNSSTSYASSFSSPPEPEASKGKPAFAQTVLEDGLDIGVYKAVLVGQIGQSPLEKKNKNGSTVVLTSVGTGGMRNERVPFPNEEPREFADRSTVQWHRVAIYHPGLGRVILSQGEPGTLVYLEGNLETRIFSDPVSGLVRRIREIAIRRNGLVVLNSNKFEFHGIGGSSKMGLRY
ncbi:hypothetical protein V2J09_019428 [Rumex salicifolius]